jgi:hypothetical protein
MLTITLLFMHCVTVYMHDQKVARTACHSLRVWASLIHYSLRKGLIVIEFFFQNQIFNWRPSITYMI